MENLAEELETTVVDLLDLENATGREVVEEVTKLSAAEKQEVLNGLKIRSWLKLLIEIVLFFALIETSKILNENEIHGKGQMLTMGLLGFVGALMGMEIYAMKKLRSGVKSEVLALKWKGLDFVLLSVAVGVALVYLGIQFFSGYGPNHMVQAILLMMAGLAVQILCCRIFGWRILKTLPLFFSLLFALWGSWLYLTSESWVNAEFGDLLCGYITPLVGCLAGWLLMHKKK